MKLCAFCDQLMQVYITLTPFMLFRNSNFILFLRTSGLKKSIILGNKIKVKTNFWIFITFIFTIIHSVNLACVFKFVILRNVIFIDLTSSQFCQNVLCVSLCGQYTIGFINSINVLRDKKINSVCALDRFLPSHSKFFSMPD